MRLMQGLFIVILAGVLFYFYTYHYKNRNVKSGTIITPANLEFRHVLKIKGEDSENEKPFYFNESQLEISKEALITSEHILKIVWIQYKDLDVTIFFRLSIKKYNELSILEDENDPFHLAMYINNSFSIAFRVGNRIGYRGQNVSIDFLNQKQFKQIQDILTKNQPVAK